MWTLLATVLTLLALTAPALAQLGPVVVGGVPLGFCSDGSVSSAAALTVAVEMR